jgi:hypothetical protein
VYVSETSLAVLEGNQQWLEHCRPTRAFQRVRHPLVLLYQMCRADSRMSCTVQDDMERRSYRMKQEKLAVLLVDAAGLSRENPEAKRAINW